MDGRLSHFVPLWRGYWANDVASDDSRGKSRDAQEKPAWPASNASLNEPEPIQRTRYESMAGALRAILVLGLISLSIATTHLTVHEFLSVWCDEDQLTSWRFFRLKFISASRSGEFTRQNYRSSDCKTSKREYLCRDDDMIEMITASGFSFMG